jgi:rRNA maturation endonuclease Nob1
MALEKKYKCDDCGHRFNFPNKGMCPHCGSFEWRPKKAKRFTKHPKRLKSAGEGERKIL